ncbi:C4-dicarboxylate ABC transporter substrate-binding protein [Halobacteriales archaeon QH_8_64_26]|nr:MAG: C4-dicarboxylate ABC transporter substrate-binding protein [Halobacteriales archaeon QH_8_64_26]
MRSIDRRTFLKAAGGTSIVGLAGCITGDGGGGGGNDTGGGTTTGGDDGGGGNDTDGNSGGGGQAFTWDAGGTGGTYYPLSNQFKQVVEANSDYSLQVRSTGASVENVGNLAGGSSAFGLIQNDIAFFAYEGTGIDEFDGSPIKSLRGVATLYPETIHLLARPGANIGSVSDLQGMAVNTGDLGSGTQVDAQQILQAVGVSEYNEQNASFSQAADQLQNGDIDAAFILGGWPVGAIENLATTSEIDIVPIDGQERQQVLDAGDYFAEDEIPGGTYQGIGEPTPTVAVQAMIATTEGQPEEAVQGVTATIFDNLGEISIKQDFISVDSAQDGMPIPLHPGAEAYFGSSGGGGGTDSTGNNSSG